MPAPIVIQVKLGEKEIPANARAIKTALDAELKDVGNLGADAGQRIGGALSSNVGLSLKKIGQEARQAGTALTAAITLPVLGLGAAVIKTGFDFEKSMNDLTAATKPTNEQLRQATALAKQLGNDLTLPAISANDAAQAMTTLAKSGLSLDQTMQAVRGTLQLAAAAGIDAAKAAEIQSDAINTFKLQAADAGRVADLLAASANSTSGEITDVADALKQAGSAAALLRVPIEDTVTALGLLAQSGVRGSDAGTSLKSALVQLAAPTKKAQEAMAQLGLEFFDAQGKLKPLRDLVEEYTSKTANLTDQQKLQTATTLAGTDGQRALNLVLGAGVEQYDKLKKATTEANAAQQLAAAKAQGGIGAFEAFKSALETLALSIFDIIKGPLISLLQVLNQVVQFLNELATAGTNRDRRDRRVSRRCWPAADRARQRDRRSDVHRGVVRNDADRDACGRGLSDPARHADAGGAGGGRVPVVRGVEKQFPRPARHRVASLQWHRRVRAAAVRGNPEALCRNSAFAEGNHGERIGGDPEVLGGTWSRDHRSGEEHVGNHQGGRKHGDPVDRQYDQADFAGYQWRLERRVGNSEGHRRDRCQSDCQSC